MKKLLLIALAFVLAIACSKDKYQTKPQISIKSINPTVVPVNGILDILLSYTDKQGDLGEDTIFIKKIRTNSRVVPTLRDSLYFQIPKYPDNPKGEIELKLDYEGSLKSAQAAPPIAGTNPVEYESDTLIFKINVKDRGGNISDTLTTGKIVVIRVQ
jgi:hypothetical protein